jgi:shikimate dehydrogenase
MTEAATPHHVTGKTRIMFILGDPIAHVVGTALFNAHLRERGIDAAAFPLHVVPADLGMMLEAIRRMRNVTGFGVTIPHKIAVLDLLDEVTDRARHVGAVNFVRRDDSGRLVGDNIDGVGFVAGLVRQGPAPQGLRVLQVGAGGAGRAIAFALAEAGVAELRIANRSADKARELAEAVQAASPSCRVSAGEADPRGCDLVVNTTSLGLHEGDPLPVSLEGLAPGATVAEVVMTPEVTPLLAEAERRGLATLRGKAMLADQIRLACGFMEL